MDQDLFQRMQEAAARFNAGESDFEEIMTPAGPAHLVRDSNDPRGFRLDFVGDGSQHTVPVQEYPPASSRPMGYPAPLPFLKGCRSIVNTVEQSVTFLDPADVEASFHVLLDQMVADGWAIIAEGDDPEDPTRVLDKEGTIRTLFVNTEFGAPRLVVREQRLPAESD